MRILVIGNEGQVVRSIVERASLHRDIEICTIGRPKLDLSQPNSVDKSLSDIAFDVIVNSAAYTAVDEAEREPGLALAVNGAGAGALARIAARRDVPIIQISTDYVFNGRKVGAWLETDPTDPLSVYGTSKLAGELSVLAASPKAVILRTAWVYSPFGQNFAKTMLRLAASRDEISVVGDQTGAPTNALDIADGIIAVARNLVARQNEQSLYGVFHMTARSNEDAPSWADFAEEIFRVSSAGGGSFAKVKHITTAQYPTLAVRPQNSLLNCDKLDSVHGVHLPIWAKPMSNIVHRILREK